MNWNQYLTSCSNETTNEDILHIESILGVALPNDLKGLLKSHQGQIPEDSMIESDEIMPVTFGPVLIASKDQTSENSYGIIYTWNIWKEHYPNLVPFAESGGANNLFALDLTDKNRPKIVFIDHEEDPESEDALLFVANTTEELINNLSARS